MKNIRHTIVMSFTLAALAAYAVLSTATDILNCMSKSIQEQAPHHLHPAAKILNP